MEGKSPLHPGLFIAAVGADNPEKQELTPALLRESKVVVDILEQAATMGDLHHALKSGLVTRADVHGELADVICGRIPGRTLRDGWLRTYQTTQMRATGRIVTMGRTPVLRRDLTVIGT